MAHSRNKLYLLLGIACLAGYIWIYWGHSLTHPVEVCLVKHFTHIPCPSCGSTRALVSITKGNFTEAIGINPIGFLIAAILLLTPLWILADIVAKQNTLFRFYQQLETRLKKPKLAVPLTILILINWIWNITKGL